jgi:hypothetical protein
VVVEILTVVMRGSIHEETLGTGADHRDIVVRTVLFAVASFAAWWCCSSLAAADEAPEVPAPQAEPAPAAAPAPTPVLFPTVVAPLVEAVTPAVDPSGAAVFPVVDAVTTPAAPVLQSVTPVADQLVGPVVGPAAGPAVGVVRPVVEQAAGAVAPVGQLVSPTVVPVTKPVTGVVTPVVDQVVSALAAPVADVAEPAVRSVLELDPRYLGLRPATADVPARTTAAPGHDATPTPAPAQPQPQPAPSPLEAEAPSDANGTRSENDASERTTGSDDAAAAILAAAPAPAGAPQPLPSGDPFHPALPPSGAVVTGQGPSDPGQRSSRLLATLPAASGAIVAPTTALGGVPAVSPLASFGGRAPVTPD